MRLKQSDLTTVYLRRVIITQDEEGNEVQSWESPVVLRMNVQSASGSVNATLYGSKLSSMKSCKYQGEELKENRDENSGICFYVDKADDPDYKITSIQPFSDHLNIMLERNDNHGR